jgi:hypothetical protein
MYLVNIGPNIFDILTFIYEENEYSLREHNSVGRDIEYNMQWSGFEPWYSYLFVLKGEILTTRLLDITKKLNKNKYKLYYIRVK